MSMDGFMDRENVVYTYNGIVFGLEKGNSAICNTMDGSTEQYMPSEGRQTETILCHLHGQPKIVKSLESESEMVGVGDGSRGTRGW